MAWLLDTNVLSELRHPSTNRKVLAFIATRPQNPLHMSSVTLAEIRFGIERVADIAHRTELNIWLTPKVRPMFAGRVWEITEKIMLRWCLLVEDGRKIGHTYSPGLDYRGNRALPCPHRRHQRPQRL